ncbi:MAG TPA: hypothetical protein VKQ10_04205 [Spirochaetota bacterium]|nr:hypothetical protein [Spirochaetota bacterium]
MIKSRIILFLSAGMLLLFLQDCFPAQSLNEIAANIDDFKGKTVTMELKLKYHDHIFNVVTFYDKDNIDITFDIKELQDEPRFKKQMLNLYRGRSYTVTFEVLKKGNLGLLIGKLIEVEPSFIKNIPESHGEEK